ncbi:MAG: BlaI/MecI/CopY family transcriptional regulator [Planctomycetaceae bacterium]|nr:BlaI/MecI/CopY family transcriptional regulator [Planctomycetaceae bacterium]
MDQPNQNELEVLRLLWEDAPQKPAEIQEAFGWAIDNGTLRSVLVSMVERGLLTRKRSGRAYVYSPKVKRETHFQQMVRRLAEVFTGGSTGQLLMELAQQERLTPEELKQLKKIANSEK